MTAQLFSYESVTFPADQQDLVEKGVRAAQRHGGYTFVAVAIPEIKADAKKAAAKPAEPVKAEVVAVVANVNGPAFSYESVASPAAQQDLVQQGIRAATRNGGYSFTPKTASKEAAPEKSAAAKAEAPEPIIAAVTPASVPAPAPAKKETKKDDDEDFDLFASDDEEEDAEKAALVAQRLKEYNEKKAAKPKPVAKSMVILDVKPWDDETDMKALEESVRGIAMEGLVWGTSKLVAIGYGIKKLQITAVVEDDKVGVDDLSDQIQAFEDYCQSVDVASFNKL
ncbi:hypothetical protein HDU79_011422 [Rhizoclosmatium sp. JEL0117]|nr:hypothetical protein HDU79_011422 [Rhizoclosmatium sp. JEL0117]